MFDNGIGIISDADDHGFHSSRRSDLIAREQLRGKQRTNSEQRAYIRITQSGEILGAPKRPTQAITTSIQVDVTATARKSSRRSVASLTGWSQFSRLTITARPTFTINSRTAL